MFMQGTRLWSFTILVAKASSRAIQDHTTFNSRYARLSSVWIIERSKVRVNMQRLRHVSLHVVGPTRKTAGG